MQLLLDSVDELTSDLDGRARHALAAMAAMADSSAAGARRTKVVLRETGRVHNHTPVQCVPYDLQCTSTGAIMNK